MVYGAKKPVEWIDGDGLVFDGGWFGFDGDAIIDDIFRNGFLSRGMLDWIR